MKGAEDESEQGKDRHPLQGQQAIEKCCVHSSNPPEKSIVFGVRRSAILIGGSQTSYLMIGWTVTRVQQGNPWFYPRDVPNIWVGIVAGWQSCKRVAETGQS